RKRRIERDMLFLTEIGRMPPLYRPGHHTQFPKGYPMLTLYHSPQTRSSTIVLLLEELGITDRVTVRQVTIPRSDGSGGRDPANPHPEGKVPLLMDGDVAIRERGAIILYLTDMFPKAGLAPVVG